MAQRKASCGLDLAGLRSSQWRSLVEDCVRRAPEPGLDGVPPTGGAGAGDCRHRFAMIIEDARSSQPESILADLDRMRGASVQLNAFVKSLIQDSSTDHRNDEPLEAFHRRLRHDLRTPLNAIKGYSELLLEDMDTDAAHPLRLDSH